MDMYTCGRKVRLPGRHVSARAGFRTANEIRLGRCRKLTSLARIVHRRERFSGLLMRGCPIIRNIVVASLLSTAFVQAAFATGAEPTKDPQVDPAPCVAAAAANDDDKTISVCGALIRNEKTARSDRIKALIAR